MSELDANELETFEPVEGEDEPVTTTSMEWKVVEDPNYYAPDPDVLAEKFHNYYAELSGAVAWADLSPQRRADLIIAMRNTIAEFGLVSSRAKRPAMPQPTQGY